MEKLSKNESVAVGAALVVVAGIFLLTGISAGIFGAFGDLVSEDEVQSQTQVPTAEDLEDAFEEAGEGFDY